MSVRRDPKPKATKIELRIDRPVRRLNLVNEVVRHLQREIMDDFCPPGTALPSEGSLARQFGVSRTVMREAMRILASKGLVEVAQGRAARVRRADPSIVVESLGTYLRRHTHSPFALLEVRRPLETEAAALAAMRATPEQTAALRNSNQRLAAAKDLAEQVAADIQFHRRLARATGNPVFVLLQQALAQLMQDYLTSTMNRIGPEHAIRSHAPIVEAIEDGDSDRARHRMAEHLRMAEDDVRRTSPM